MIYTLDFDQDHIIIRRYRYGEKGISFIEHCRGSFDYDFIIEKRIINDEVKELTQDSYFISRSIFERCKRS